MKAETKKTTKVSSQIDRVFAGSDIFILPKIISNFEQNTTPTISATKMS